MEQPFCPGCISKLDADDLGCPACSMDRPDAGWPRDEHIGRLISGKYMITERLGEGGFGVVLRGHQTDGEREYGDVALKLLHPHLARNPSARKRFNNEVRAARALTSPHAVKIFELGFDEHGIPYFVMEYLEGQPLQSVLGSGLAPTRIVRLGLQIARTLDECHSRQILHLDLKPENIFLLPDGDTDFVKIIDFGIARVPDCTISKTIIGTPRYMPPEQITGQELDEGVDIFALGVILFECFTEQPPVDGSSKSCTPMEYLQRNVKSEARLLRELKPELPRALETLLDSMMARDRADRPASMADVEARLKSIGAAQGWLPELGPALRQKASATRTLDGMGGAEARPDPGGGKKRRGVLALVALTAVVGGLGLFLLRQGSRTGVDDASVGYDGPREARADVLRAGLDAGVDTAVDPAAAPDLVRGRDLSSPDVKRPPAPKKVTRPRPGKRPARVKGKPEPDETVYPKEQGGL